MDDRWKPLSRTGGQVAPFAVTMTIDQLLAAAPTSPARSRERIGTEGGSKDAAGVGDQYIVHNVTKSDTLMGIALRYGVSIAELRFVNDIPSGTDNLATSPVLRIPTTHSRGDQPSRNAEKESHAALSRRFRVTNGVSESEAAYYLGEASWDYELAERTLRADLAFEKTAEGIARLKSTDATSMRSQILHQQTLQSKRTGPLASLAGLFGLSVSGSAPAPPATSSTTGIHEPISSAARGDRLVPCVPEAHLESTTLVDDDAGERTSMISLRSTEGLHRRRGAPP